MSTDSKPVDDADDDDCSDLYSDLPAASQLSSSTATTATNKRSLSPPETAIAKKRRHNDNHDKAIHTTSSMTKKESSRTAQTKAPTQLHHYNMIEKEQQEIIEKLQQELENLKGENEVLKRNMGTLYRTVKKELTRKDNIICDLQDQLDRFQQQQQQQHNGNGGYR